MFLNFELCFTPVLHSSSVSPLFLTPFDSWKIHDYWFFSKCLPFFLFLHFLVFFNSRFSSLLFWNLPFESLSCSILKKKIVFFSRSFSFTFFTFHPFFITFCFHLFQHLLQFDPSFQCLLILLASFFFENVSSLTFFAHMFLSSLSFFLFHRFSFFLYSLFHPSLVFRIFFYLFWKNCVFILCPCRDAEAFSHHWKGKKTWWSHPECVVKNQIACVVKIVLCELRIGRKPDQCRLISTTSFLLWYFCIIFSDTKFHSRFLTFSLHVQTHFQMFYYSLLKMFFPWSLKS